MAQTFLKVQDRGMDDKKNERVNESSVLKNYFGLLLTQNKMYLQLWEHWGIITAMLKYSKQIPQRSKSSTVWNIKTHVYQQDINNRINAWHTTFPLFP